MKKLTTSSREILSARKTDSRGARRFNGSAAAFRCALPLLLLLIGMGAAEAQQPDPLTITKDGNVGIGTTAPGEKLEVAGSVYISGSNSLRFSHRFGDADDGKIGNSMLAPGLNLVGINNDNTFRKIQLWGQITQSENKATNTWSGTNFFNGNVGLGTTVPGERLEVAGNVYISGSYLRFTHTFGDANDGKIGNSMFAPGLNLVGINNDNTLRKIQLWGQITQQENNGTNTWGGTNYFNGSVGVGTTTPRQAKLVVIGSTIGTFRPYGYLSRNSTRGNFSSGGSQNVPYSIYASDRVAAAEFNAFSDERIKKIQGRSDSAMDLRTLLGIEITDYRYKDVIAKGNGAYKKVIGQQIEKVFPQAVSKSTDIVPDIYQKATIKDGWVMLATNLKKGERVRLIGEKQEGIHEVLEVAEGRFRTSFATEGGQVFVYGREVNDARSVDYEAISMLNVSATQQIKKEKDEEVKALQEENAALRSQLAEQEKRLAVIESLLLSADKPAAAPRH